MAQLDADVHHGLRAFDLELTLAVGDETLALVGPSGAGKSTLLRAVAGLERPDRGRIALDGEVWLDTDRGVDVPPERRSVGLVFQEYALFPHLSVRRNVAFGGASTAEVDEFLERFGIAALAAARPDAISGGERQRVALARALARRPRVLLLDEPLSALDAHTRSAVRGELRGLLAGLGLPVVLVTQAELVAAPVDPFVARFTGANLVRGTSTGPSGGLTEVVLDVGGTMWSTDALRGRVAIAVHPWEISLSRTAPDDSAVNHLRAPIASITSLGNRARVAVGPLVAEVTAGSVERLGLREGDVVVASFKATAARLVPFA